MSNFNELSAVKNALMEGVLGLTVGETRVTMSLLRACRKVYIDQRLGFATTSVTRFTFAQALELLHREPLYTLDRELVAELLAEESL